MKNDITSNIRLVQKTQLKILCVFMDFCERHHLRWYMSGGSLIGVYRHHGFIPWDDDIDLHMPREDYDRFVKMQKELPGQFTLTTHDNVPEWQFNFCQFVDNNSEIIVHMNEQPRRCKIWIDIFPLDGLPENRFRRWLHLKRVMAYRYLIQMHNIRTQVDTHKVGRPFYEKVILKVLHFIPIGKLVNVNHVLAKMEYSLKKYSFDTSTWAGNLLGKYREKEAMPKKWWGEPVLKKFEDILVNCPSDSEKILSHIYGSYMSLPPEEERVSHDVEIIRLR